MTSAREILAHRSLSARFQPIASLSRAEVYGYEGLIRGPDNTPLHPPLALFRAAQTENLLIEVEYLSRQIILEAYAQFKISGKKLFLNVNPYCLGANGNGITLQFIQKLGLNQTDIIIEITETSPTSDYELLRRAVTHYRNLGFAIALDDLGEGFASLRLWSELHPDYIKIDKHFIGKLHQDAIKLEFVRAICHIAESLGCQVIAEGIETEAELDIVYDLGIKFGQGYFLGLPLPEPTLSLSPQATAALEGHRVCVLPSLRLLPSQTHTVAKLAQYVPPVSPKSSNQEAFARFENEAELHALPVVEEDGTPVGLINRYTMTDSFARPYRKELFGRHSCTMFMDPKPLVVESSMHIQALSHMFTTFNLKPFANHFFIITDNGRYLGIGSILGLLREITEMQLETARHVNPLTLLPGNFLIEQHLSRLLSSQRQFWACYLDLDHFKAYNDTYGFRQGDELIKNLARILNAAVDPQYDFIGHIGGDDFVLLLQSEDWEKRLAWITEEFAEKIKNFYSPQDLIRGGLEVEDRVGNKTFCPLVSLSIGVVPIPEESSLSHYKVAEAMTEAKRQAKKIPGNAIFIERRKLS